jgi:hypothetical protein
MAIFQRKQIPGNVFVDEATSGIFPYKLEDTLDTGWDNVHTITDIHLYGHHAGLDFQQRMLQISGIVQTVGFGTLTNVEKDIVGIYSATSDNDLVTHYATIYTAGDVIAALEMHAEKIGDFVTEMNHVAINRIDHPSTKKAIMKYMKDRPQIDLFMAAIRNFVADYKFKFHIGTQYGDSTDGILDYIENTGGYNLAGTGLGSYEFSDLYKQVWYDANAVDPQNPTQIEQDLAHAHVRDLLKTDLVNILLHGIT